MSTNENLFWELLELSDATLVVDNDCCYITYNKDEEGDTESQSFDFGPEDLAFIFGKKLDIKMEKC